MKHSLQLLTTESSPVQTEPALTRPVIVARNANLIYPAADKPVHALHDIDLTIRQGEFVSLIGPSGCGKTTLLRAIADLESITSGELLVNDMTPSEARLSGAYGYVFQAPALFQIRACKSRRCWAVPCPWCVCKRASPQMSPS